MSEQIFQIAAKALIRNDLGQILMVHIPEWSGNKAHWDLPGGRMDEGEKLEETLKRELKEEVDIELSHKPKQLMTFLTNITIPVGDKRLPLMFVVYEVNVTNDVVVKLDPDSAEDEFKWFTPKKAAIEMKYKFSEEFCRLVSNL